MEYMQEVEVVEVGVDIEVDLGLEVEEGTLHPLMGRKIKIIVQIPLRMEYI